MEIWRWSRVGHVTWKTLGCRDLRGRLGGVMGMCIQECTGCQLSEHQCQLLPLHHKCNFVSAPPH